MSLDSRRDEHRSASAAAPAAETEPETETAAAAALLVQRRPVPQSRCCLTLDARRQSPDAASAAQSVARALLPLLPSSIGVSRGHGCGHCLLLHSAWQQRLLPLNSTAAAAASHLLSCDLEPWPATHGTSGHRHGSSCRSSSLEPATIDLQESDCPRVLRATGSTADQLLFHGDSCPSGAFYSWNTRSTCGASA